MRDSWNYGERGKRRSFGFRRINAGRAVKNGMTVTGRWSAIADNSCYKKSNGIIPLLLLILKGRVNNEGKV